MRGTSEQKRRAAAAKENAATYAQRYLDGVSSKDLAAQAGIGQNAMIEILRSEGIDFEQAQKDRRMYTVRRAGTHSGGHPVRREPDMDEMRRPTVPTEPRERPLLFSTPMVLAILAGQKTVTRRVVKPAHLRDALGPSSIVRCPYGQPGDRLWVKETWSTPPGHYELMKPSEVPAATSIRYAADGAVRGKSEHFMDRGGRYAVGRLRPSIFMPRWASRLTLEVVSGSVDRGPISMEEARAEGFESPEAWAQLYAELNGIPVAEALEKWRWRVEFRRLP